MASLVTILSSAPENAQIILNELNLNPENYNNLAQILSYKCSPNPTSREVDFIIFGKWMNMLAWQYENFYTTISIFGNVAKGYSDYVWVGPCLVKIMPSGDLYYNLFLWGELTYLSEQKSLISLSSIELSKHEPFIRAMSLEMGIDMHSKFRAIQENSAILRQIDIDKVFFPEGRNGT